MNLLLMQGGSTGAMRACELNRDIVILRRIIIKYYKISQEDGGAVVPPLNQAVLCVNQCSFPQRPS